MKILIINGHPDAKSYSAAITAEFTKNLDKQRHQIENLELGKMKFDPVLRFGYRQKMPPNADIERSQQLLKWADHMVFIYPIWWSSMPSLLKGWIDRVMTPGFAYNMKSFYRHDGHLSGRTAELILTSDAPAFYYRWLAPTPVRLMRNHILKLCGIRTTRVQIFGKTQAATDERRQKFLEQIKERAKNL
jgi:putative NADPH-quinone reductase